MVYDSSKYYEQKTKLPKPDGIHCIICGEQFDKPDKRRSYCSQECFSKWYFSLIDSWSRVREQVLKRDGKCLKCGLKIGAKRDNIITVFEVHHTIPICEGGGEFDPDNCMTLCYDCHKEMHTIVGKKKRNNRSLEEFMNVPLDIPKAILAQVGGNNQLTMCDTEKDQNGKCMHLSGDVPCQFLCCSECPDDCNSRCAYSYDENKKVEE